MMLDPSFYGEPDNPAKKRGGTAATQSPPVKANVALDHSPSNTVEAPKQLITPAIPALWHEHRVSFDGGEMICVDCGMRGPLDYETLLGPKAKYLTEVPKSDGKSGKSFLESRLFYMWLSSVKPRGFLFSRPHSRWVTRCISSGRDRAVTKEKLKLEGGAK